MNSSGIGNRIATGALAIILGVGSPLATTAAYATSDGAADAIAAYDGETGTLKGFRVDAAADTNVQQEQGQEQHSIYLMPEREHDGNATEGTTVRFIACVDAPEGTKKESDFLKYAATDEQLAEIEWASSNPDVLTVDENGVATCVAPGRADVTATYKGAKDVYKHFVVKRHVFSVGIADEHKKSAEVGETVQFGMFVDLPEGVKTAEGRLEYRLADDEAENVKWETSDSDIMTIDENGTATCTGKGLADVTATYKGETYKVRNFKVTSADTDAQQEQQPQEQGQDQQEQGQDQQGQDQDQQGQDQDQQGQDQDQQGQDQQEQHSIFVALEGDNDGEALIGETVRFIACVDAPEGTKKESDFLKYAATDEQLAEIEWTSSNPDVLRIDENGVAKCVGVGHADVTATFKGASDKYTRFKVNQHVLSIAATGAHQESARIGDRVQFGAFLDMPNDTTDEARASYALGADEAKKVKWETSDPSIMTIDESGKATCVGTGTVTISATYRNLKSEYFDYSVIEAPFFVDADPDDTANHGKDVEWMGRKGISAGWSAGSGREFRGMEDVKRCDFAAFLFRMADLADNGKLDSSIALSDERVDEVLANVSDVNPNTPHAAEVAWMIDNGISRGWQNANGTVSFRPYATVARQDMAAFLYRYEDLGDNGVMDDSCAKQAKSDVVFSDMERNDEANHAKEVYWLGAMGISEGWEMQDGTREFRGTSSVKRQDMAAFMHRM